MTSSRASVFIWIAWMMLGFGGLLNGLEACLIVCHSPKEMHAYSQILLQICATDVLSIIIAPLTQPIFYTSSFAHTETFFGPIGALSTLWQTIAFSFECWLYYVSIGTLTLEFVYRYLVLIKDKSIPFRQYLCMFGGVCLGLFLDVFIYALIAYPIDDCRYLSVDPEAMTVLESPAETQLALCIKHVNL